MRMMKVRRYWTGRVPEWAEFGNEEEEGDILMVRADALPRQGLAFPKDVGIDNDSRLRRLADTRIGNRDEVRADHRRIRQVEIVSTYQVERGERELIDMAGEEEEEEEGVLDERRERIKERNRLREKEVEAINAALLSEEEEEEGEEEEEESEEDYTNIAIMKPMYVHKDERETVAERKRFEAKEEAIKENARRRLAERKVETKQVLVEEIWKEQMIKKNQETEVVVDVANSDHEAEYEAWKLREVARIKRDRKMMEEEKRECESRKPESPPRKKMRFLQKRYHKGAFFQDEADDPASTVGTYEILKRDFSAPTGEDKMDKTILPKVMQVKHFGRRGRVKWSHLVNEDTTHIGINLCKLDDVLLKYVLN